jgi:DnaK suppressor protein
MDQAFIEKVKKEFIEQRKQILASLEARNNEMKDLVKPIASGDEVDVASDANDIATLTSLGAQDAAMLERINAALDRINQGTYGRCVKCGKEIPMERLTVLPYAVMCVPCASEEERRNR